MPAKSKKSTPEKRIRPVVEVVEEPQEEVLEEVVEEVVEETPSTEPVVEEEVSLSSTGGVSVEPDFSAPEVKAQETPEDSTVPENETKTEVEEVKEDPKPVAEPKPTEAKMSIKSVILIAFISALVAAFVSGGVYVYLNGVSSMKSEEKSEETTPTEAPVATPEPTEAPAESVEVSSYKIQVLNGSGQIGAAGKAGDALKASGFVIEDVGNAQTRDYTDTIVAFKEDVPVSVIDKLVTALESSYSVQKSSKSLVETSEYDIVVTVGTD